MFYLKKQTGVTLIELTVVLLILVALAGVALPYLGGTSSTALCNATDVSMQNIKKVIMERYYLDTLGYFPKNTKTGNDYNLTYLFTKPTEWNLFDPQTQIGWRQGGYLQTGVFIATAPNDSFKASSGNVHTDIIGTQALDAWGRPIILQAYCSNSAYSTKPDCESNNATWVGRLVSAGAGSGLGINEAEIDTSMGSNKAGDDRVLYLNAPPPASDVNVACDIN